VAFFVADFVPGAQGLGEEIHEVGSHGCLLALMQQFARVLPCGPYAYREAPVPGFQISRRTVVPDMKRPPAGGLVISR
jgi:hypothetical protein